MRAKFPGRCARTGLQIRVGDDIKADGRGGWLPGSTAAAAVQYEGPPAAAAPGLAGRGAWGGDGVAREGTGGRPGGRGSRNSTRLSSRWPIPSRLKSI